MSTSFVRLCTFPTEMAAETTRWALAQEGIPSFLENANAATTFAGNTVGWVKLMVAEEHAARALELVNQHPHLLDGVGGATVSVEQGTVPPDTAATVERETCLACGAPLERDETACRKCGWSYAENTAAETGTDSP